MDCVRLLALVAAAGTGPELSPADLDRFPGYDAALSGRHFADEYLEHLEGRWRNAGARRDDLELAMALARRHRDCWNELENAQAMRDDAAWCRRHLGRLRGFLGRSSYEQGLMPPPVPLGLLERLDGPLVEGH